jgi:hypothetical protein
MKLRRRRRRNDVQAALARATKLRSKGRFDAAIVTLVEANRLRRDVQLERHLIRLRHEAFPSVQRQAVAKPRSDPRHAGVADATYPPVVAADELSSDVLASTISSRGGLHVERVASRQRTEQLIEDIDNAFAGFDEHAEAGDGTEATPWFEPFEPGPGAVHLTRPWLRLGGGMFAADSPRTFFDLLETYEDAGVLDVVSGYLGERPVVSLDKCTLRRVCPGQGITWHQDGAFLGTDFPAVNVWLSLSDSGVRSPGLELVPRRLEHIVNTGTEDAEYPWSVASSVVDAARAGLRLCRPVLAPGDALVFDHLLLHRTYPGTEMRTSEPRYAIETWFFAPSSYPAQQRVPLVI